MTKLEIQNAIRDIGLALNLSHNTVTTDVPIVADELAKSDMFWRINNSKEIDLLNQLEEYFNQYPKFDQKEFDEMVEKGTKAWADVADATAWVEDLRGNIL